MEKVNIMFLLLFIFMAFACKEHTTKVVEDKEIGFAFSTSGCNSAGLEKGAATYSDSICTYSFTDRLIMDFSVYGNCCPDSNRFIVDYKIQEDSIFIAVKDTAQNLCRCNCLYMIHAEISELPLNQYVVRCSLKNGENYTDPIHLFTVKRK